MKDARMTSRWLNSRWMLTVSALCLMTTGLADTVLAQADSVTLIAGRPLRGTVESYTPDNIIVSTSDGNKEVSPWNVRRIRYDGSNELVRAKSAYHDDRFAACLQELQNVPADLDREVLKQERDFYLAMASTMVALRGGNVSADQAAILVGQFIKDYPESYHLYQAIDAFGDLAMATGRFDAAITQFEKTSVCPWPEINFNGKLKSGKSLLYEGKYAEAIKAFESTESDGNAEDYAIQAKLIAKCLRAQALGLGGNASEGINLAMDVIENESSKNIELFGHAYNALGACYSQEKKTKEAIRAYLHTDLLFTIDPDSHAQALFNLVGLWSESERPDRASRARQKLTERYRNTYWASKAR